MPSDCSLRGDSSPGRARDGLSARILRRVISNIEFGHITIVLPSSARIECHGAQPGVSAMLTLHRWRAAWRLFSQGDIGFAEAYVDGDWSSPDLAILLEFAARNIASLDRRISGLLPVRILNGLRHLVRANSKSGSRKNIAYHYDLGNRFYECWLDPSMTYSSALYASTDETLEAAQDAKMSRIVELADLHGGERILEIGCGWGALATRLAHSGARVTGITLSSEQLAFALHRVEQENLDQAISLALMDYRETAGTYDRVVSIEMMEAVGEAYWPTYFKTLRDRLKVGGIAVLQVITIDEARFESYRRSPDFIQRHIFPGGMLPTKEILVALSKSAGFDLIATHRFGRGYARTLAEWRKRFLLALPRIEAMGFSEQFRRLWDYYLCYCQAGFTAGTIDVGLYVLVKT